MKLFIKTLPPALFFSVSILAFLIGRNFLKNAKEFSKNTGHSVTNFKVCGIILLVFGCVGPIVSLIWIINM